MLNGEEMADSQFIMDSLSVKYGRDLSKNLSDSEKGIERAYMKLTEESLFWCMALQRFIYEPNPDHSGLSKAILLYAGWNVGKRSKAHGYGLHSREES
jgi:hypothetical protein